MSPWLQRTGATLALVLGLLASAGAPAVETAAEEARLPTVVVSALGLSDDEPQVGPPATVLDGDALLQKGAGTLGSALDGAPGVHADTFGGGASRPLIRGQGGPRIRILSDGAGVLDASGLSPDHAVTADPMLLHRVEILRGPATLLHGSGTVGGVVNLLDGRVPDRLPDGHEGRLAVRGNTVAGERAGAAAISGAAGSNLAWHLEGSHVASDDYRVPHEGGRRIADTFARSANASAGLSWLGEWGYAGLAWSRRSDDYGLPGHSHEHGDCHPHGGALHCGHAHGEDDHDHDHHGADVDLHSRRLDLRGELDQPLAWVRRIRVRASHTGYRHDERDDGIVATTFRNRGHEERIELEHLPVAGWTGILGLQHADTRLAITGLEAFLPPVRTRSTALFAMQHRDLGEHAHLELAARQERLRHQPQDARQLPAFSSSARSFSGALSWTIAAGTSSSLSLTHSQRPPQAQELYARGVHLATGTFECGLLPDVFTCGGSANDAPLRQEKARNLEWMIRHDAGPLILEASLFRNAIDHYIHARTLDRHEDFQLIKYSQRDAVFRGFEAALGYRPSERFEATVFADRVHARFADGGALPRIPAGRTGLRMQLASEPLRSRFELYRVSGQRRTAAFEAPTPGYTMLNLDLEYRLAGTGRGRVFVHGSNLLDRLAWNHASFLAETVPLPGRNISAGYRLDF